MVPVYGYISGRGAAERTLTDTEIPRGSLLGIPRKENLVFRVKMKQANKNRESSNKIC